MKVLVYSILATLVTEYIREERKPRPTMSHLKSPNTDINTRMIRDT